MSNTPFFGSGTPSFPQKIPKSSDPRERQIRAWRRKATSAKLAPLERKLMAAPGIHGIWWFMDDLWMIHVGFQKDYIRRPLPSRRGGAWDHRRCAASARAIFLAMSVASCPFSCPCLSRNHPAKREAPLCSPLPAPCQVEIVQLEGFKTCAKHVPPGPETLPCSFSLCQRFARSYLAFRRFHPRTRNPPVHLSPFAFALPSQNIAFRGFQNLREARSTRAPNPSVQL